FWQPSAVVSDTEVLETLPPREYRSGLGEMAKYHFLGGEALVDCNLDERVARCVAIKADVVASDEREGGRRAILNYGHTLGHALETAGHYDVRHGEAVAIGLVFAAVLAERLGRIDRDRVEEHRRVVGGYDLPMNLPPDADAAQLIDLEHLQSNAEADLVDAVQGARGRCAAIIVNAAALTHYAWSLSDALATFEGAVVELHLSNPMARETWRHTSVVAPVADGLIAG